MSKRKPKKSEKPKSLDEMLTVPESVLDNPAELKRYLERKSAEEAERIREQNEKEGVIPTVEQLCADMVRVASDPNVNPFHADKTLSGKRYKRHGRYLFTHCEREFGTFDHALEVAGLRDKRGTKLWKSARSEQSRREHAQRYQERCLKPHVLDTSKRRLTGVEVGLVLSDTHATHLNPFVWHTFLSECLRLEPDYVVLNGDILEGAEISRHPKIPGWSVPLQLEFDFARTMFEQIRKVAPDAEVIWTAGNHGLDRLAAYLSQVAPALSGLRSLRFDKLAGLDDLGIKLAQGGSLASPEGEESDLPGILLHDYLIHHGTLLGQSPQLSELRKALRSGTSGHVHRAGMAYMSHEGQSISWMSTPMGCSPSAGRAYMKGRHTGWQMGFGVFMLHPGGRVHQYPVICDRGVAICEGYLYEDHEQLEADPMANWIVDFPVPS